MLRFIIHSSIIFMVLMNSVTFGQKLFSDYDYDPEYIRSYHGKLTTRAFLLYESIGFGIMPSNSRERLSYHPNIYTRTGISFNYKWLGVGMSIKNPVDVLDNDKKGTSRVIDLRSNVYGRSVSFELAYQDIKGFYLGDVRDIPGTIKPGESYYLRPDMELQSFFAIFYYIMNYKRHSARAAYIQNERQLKSSGSPVFMPSFLYVKLNADSSLIPEEFAVKHNTIAGEKIRSGRFLTFGLSAGYSYTWVFLKHFYINGSFIPGIFLQNSNYQSDKTSTRNNELTMLWLCKTAFGYNSDKFYAGMGGVFGYITSPLKIGGTNFNFDMNQLRIWVGTRFRIRR